jgi:NAD-dependent dihydropyrimidine dehydrogenase PreA subunit
VGAEEALAVLDRVADHGLVHLGIYSPDQPLLSLCSCCPCCCYQLGMLLALDRKDLVVKSDYVVSLDMSLCDGCGLCLEACHFGACLPGECREVGRGPELNADGCYGCGLCVRRRRD